MYHSYAMPSDLKQETLYRVKPWVQYGLNEAQKTSIPHAMMEIAAIAYLMGKGYDPRTAHQIVESCEGVCTIQRKQLI